MSGEFLPLVADALLTSLGLLTAACKTKQDASFRSRWLTARRSVPATLKFSREP